MSDVVRTILLQDPEYPELLRHIHRPPKQLYGRGNLALLTTPCMAVVGTRKITPYGKEAAEYITQGLTMAQYTIVSGLAMGIDAVAHAMAVRLNAPTIAVLGSAIDDPTPHINRKLAQSILEHDGLIISEYAPGAPTVPGQFPARNRIVSGISKGVVVIEADKESGALITAQCALDQNRDVFAVPGNVFSPRSVGPNMLIQKGAKLVMNAQDILAEYNQLYQAELSEDISTQNPIEQRILAILNTNGPTHVDTIIRESAMDTSKIMSSIAILEIRGNIKHLGNGIYKK